MTGLVGSAPRTVRSRVEDAVRHIQALQTRRAAAAEHRWLMGRMRDLLDHRERGDEPQNDQSGEVYELLHRDCQVHGGTCCDEAAIVNNGWDPATGSKGRLH